MLVTQTLDKKKYEAVVKNYYRTFAFKEWQHRLSRGDRLPRGKYFKGKLAGKPFMMMDESHFLNESFAVINDRTKRACLRLGKNQI